MLLFALLTTFLSLALLWCLYLLKSKAYRFMESIPGPPINPLLGNALQFKPPDGCLGILEHLNQLLEWNQRYGNRFRYLVGHLIYSLVLTDMKDLEKVMTSQALITKGRTYDFLLPWIGEGLLTAAGDKWRHHRKLLTPAFHFKMVEPFQQVSDEQSKILVEIMRNKQEKKESCDIHHMYSLCALSIICEASMGTKLNCQLETNAYTEAVIKQTQFIFNRWIKPWLHSDLVWYQTETGKLEKENLKILRDFIHTVVQERRKTVLSDKREDSFEEADDMPSKKRLALLDLLIDLQESGKGLTDEDIYDETATFTFEAHDTTAACLTWTTYLLAKHPEHQVKVQEELDSILGNDRDRVMTTADLAKMKYLECCIKESLRLYPSVPKLSRKVMQDFHLDEKTIIPAGVDLVISPWLIHRQPNVWPEPDKFDPERHTPENAAGRYLFAFLPFSAGPRNCVGQRVAYAEVKTILAHIFHSFHVKLANPLACVKEVPELVIRPKENIEVCLDLRKE